MAAVAVQAAMNLENQPNQLHPFFRNSNKNGSIYGGAGPNGETDASRAETGESGTEQQDGPKPAKRGRKKQPLGKTSMMDRFYVNGRPNTAESGPSNAHDDEMQHAELEADPNEDRRKRRKTASPERPMEAEHADGATDQEQLPLDAAGLDWCEQLRMEASRTATEHASTKGDVNGVNSREETDLGAFEDGQRETEVLVPRSSPPREPVSNPATSLNIETETTKPQRTMRLKGGKLASPGASKKKAMANAKDKSLRKQLVKISYATVTDDVPKMGARVQAILEGRERHERRSTAKPTTPVKKKKPVAQPKSTHPFFLGKAARADAKKDSAPDSSTTMNSSTVPWQSPRKASATTPGKIRAARDAFRVPSPPRQPVQKKTTFAKTDYPAWPSRESMHVRGYELTSQDAGVNIASVGFASKSKKRKVIVDDLESQSEPSKRAKLVEPGNPDDDFPRRRVPQRKTVSGVELRESAVTSLASQHEWSSHPALVDMAKGIETELSPFDKFECETYAWTQKYAPKRAEDVLQAGREAYVLRDWLQRSTISAVHTSSNRSTASSVTSTKAKIAPKKRKRKEDDDWLVASDEELEDETELLPLEDKMNSKRPLDRRSCVRGGNDYQKAKIGSTVLLSGPNGSGKTAAVYAVAKELGFQVFEINSATRRSGRDILDKIGDMTENHLVQQVSKALTEDKVPDTVKPAAIEIDKPDVPDPKQKKMASFFQAKPASAAPKQPLLKAVVKTKEVAKPAKVKQKQSLILLEEVDVLFEEDKQFWMTVLTLALHSKRPIVMTCNDEAFVPVSLTLHAKLRFEPPPLDLAVDYLGLLAAREGHLLARDALVNLYRTNRHDLRASISALDFWCQMAVGDPTRGFNWMIDRYPPGVDLDAEGRTLRVVSCGTLPEDGNVVSQDLALMPQTPLDKASSLLASAWDDWQIDPMDLKPDFVHAGAVSLDMWNLVADAMSAGDICFGRVMRRPEDQPCDASLPPLTEKRVASYALALSGSQDVLQAEHPIDNMRLDTSLAITSHVLAQTIIGGDQPTPPLESRILSQVAASRDPDKPKDALNRNDFSHAFNEFAYDLESDPSNTAYFPLSSFDREFAVITADLGPYVRAITSEYQRTEEEKLRMSNLLSAGGKRRQTRSAFSALEGGRRAQMRRARYFERMGKMGVRVGDVLDTAGSNWPQLRREEAVTAPESVDSEEEVRIGGQVVGGGEVPQEI